MVHRARKALGQNFLVDPNIQQKIVEAVAPDTGDEILEIGPGHGAITQHLAGTVARFVAVELDVELAAALRERYAGNARVTIVHANILSIDIRDLFDDPARVKVAGNIPYNITSPLIFHLLERDRRPGTIVLMVQREVAERILAAPGEGDYGALTVGVRAVASVERLFNVGRGAFRPVPAVDSTVLRITPIRPPPLSVTDEHDLRALTRAVFGWRRKQLQKTLRSAPEYAVDHEAVASLANATGVDLQRRPETLAPADLVALARALRALGLPSRDAHAA